jgi:two-component system, LytTR family, sensor kinase
MTSIIKSKSYKSSIALVILVITIVQFLFLKFAGITYSHGFLFVFLFGICLLVSFLLIGNNLNYYHPSNFNYSFLIGWCIVFTTICLFIPKTVCRLIIHSNQQINALLDTYLYYNFISIFLVLACYSAICIVWYQQNEAKENEFRKQEAIHLNKEAELLYLKKQLQPHFLFNSLNSINALIGVNQSQARDMVTQLSDFLRYTIKKQNNEMVTLKEEMENLALYFSIEKVRFGHRLITTITINANAEMAQIPALLLQPILENAIKFGLYDTLDEVEIKINATIEDHHLIIEITNPFDGTTHNTNNGTGFGLSSVQRRLELIFNRKDLLTTNTIGFKYIAQIKIPQQL